MLLLHGTGDHSLDDGHGQRQCMRDARDGGDGEVPTFAGQNLSDGDRLQPTCHCPARQRWSLVADALVQNLPELIAFLRDRQPSEIAAVTTTGDRLALQMLAQAVRLGKRRERTAAGRAAPRVTHHFATLGWTAATEVDKSCAELSGHDASV